MNKAVFNPNTIAIIGATDQENSVGRGLVENLENRADSPQIFYVNPDREELFGKKTYSSVTDIEVEIDLAIVAVPKSVVLPVIDDCVEKDVGGVLVVSAGFAESGEEGEKRQEKLKNKLEQASIPLIGPNCLGILRPPVRLNASFAPGSPKMGSIALISQSGALIDSIIDGVKTENYGFSLMISVGNAAGMGVVDYLEVADEDPNTEVICLYVEGIENGRKFLEGLKNTEKPVLVIKGGKTDSSKEAISSHTGSLAGNYEVFSAALQQGGAIEVTSLEEMFDAAKLLSWQTGSGKRVGIVTNGGGAGVLLTDYLKRENLELADFKNESIEKLEGRVHPDYSKSNPLDIVGDALPDQYEAASEVMINQSNVDGLVVIQTLQIMTEPVENAKRLIELKQKYDKPIVAVFMGKGEKTSRAVELLEENGIPNYQEPKRAARSLSALLN